MKHLGILLSGRGSNFLAIADNVAAGKIPNAEIAVVISNKPYVPGIQAAEQRGLNAHVIQGKGLTRAEHDAAVVACLREHKVDLVCLAGYMRLLSPVFLEAFPQQVLNIHPSLLPAFPGLDAQRQALEYGVQVSGCTVHFVDEHLDHGVIIIQRSVSVMPDDDEHSLAQRILEQEHIAYSEAIRMVLSGEYEISGRRYVKKNGSSTDRAIG
jgi:phosphoribosylglycinamide formyltransferase-1